MQLHSTTYQTDESFRDRFFSHVLIPDDSDACWEWQGSRTAKGYGCTSYHNKSLRAHRVSYEINIGHIPDGFDVCHHCDNPPCVRPLHLFVGTRSDNMLDARDKGRLRPFNPRFYGTANGRAKLTLAFVQIIRQRFASGTTSMAALAKEFDVHWCTIRDVVRYKTWVN